MSDYLYKTGVATVRERSLLEEERRKEQAKVARRKSNTKFTTEMSQQIWN